MVAEIPVGVVPASKPAFGGPLNTGLFATAAPKAENCKVFRASVEITDSSGHVGTTRYPVSRGLNKTTSVTTIAADNRKRLPL